MKEVIFHISKDGQEIKAEAKGFKGKGCVETIGKMIAGLGEKLGSGHTPEFYQEEGVGVKAGG